MPILKHMMTSYIFLKEEVEDYKTLKIPQE